MISGVIDLAAIVKKILRICRMSVAGSILDLLIMWYYRFYSIELIARRYGWILTKFFGFLER